MLESDERVLRNTLERWLAPRLSASVVTVDRFSKSSGSGFSAQTFLLEASCHSGGAVTRRPLVLRCQNSDSDLFLNASIELPYRVMEAVGRYTHIPVPPLIGLEMNPSVLGEPFLVMEEMPGQVVQQSPNYNVAGWLADLPLDDRGRVWRAGLDVLAEIHRLEWRPHFKFLAGPEPGEPGLESFLAGISNWYQWVRGQGAVIELMDMGLNYLLHNQPPPLRPVYCGATPP